MSNENNAGVDLAKLTRWTFDGGMTAQVAKDAGAAAKTEQAPMEYRTCCDHPDCTTCAGRGGFFRLSVTVVGAGSEQPGACDACKGRGELFIAGVMGRCGLCKGAALARAPLPAQGENVAAANAGELDLDDLDNTAKEALRDLSYVENHLEQSDAPTKVKNRAVDVRLCIKELRAALNDRAGAQDGQPVDDARDAALAEIFAAIDEAQRMNRYNESSFEIGKRVARLKCLADDYRAAMSASRPDDKGEKA